MPHDRSKNLLVQITHDRQGPKDAHAWATCQPHLKAKAAFASATRIVHTAVAVGHHLKPQICDPPRIQHFPDHKALRPITSPATAATDAVVKPTMTSKAVLDVRCVVCGVHMAAEVHNVHVWVCEQATDRDAIVAHATDPIRWVVGQNDELGARLLRSLHPTL